MKAKKFARAAFWRPLGGAAVWIVRRSRAAWDVDRRGAHDSLADYNREFYDGLWRDAELIAPARFNTWPVVSELLAAGGARLEIGPGLRPRLPLAGTHFVDLSEAAVKKLIAAGGMAEVGEATALPAATGAYGLVCALDVVEHVEDGEAALREIARVTRPGGTLLFSAPLHPDRWISFDRTVGHARRFPPDALAARLAHHGFTIESSAVYGMQPASSRLLDFGMRCLERHRHLSMWFYSRVFMPLGLRRQSRLRFEPGFAAAAADEVLLVCRRI